MFNPIAKRDHLSKIVALDIEKAILSKNYLANEKLPSEQDFCDQFGVSRTAVREALQTLSARGLIRIEKGRGAFVERLSAKTVTDPFYLFLELRRDKSYELDVLRARQLIEPPVAGLAALNHDVEDISKLKANLDLLSKSSKRVEEVAQIDMEFHILLAKATKNDIMPLILDPIHRLMPKIKVSILETVDNAKDSAYEWHSKILKQVLDRNDIGAYNAMKDHLEHAEQHMREMLRKVYDNKEVEMK